MRTRTLLLILLLYSALVWVWSAYKYSGEQIIQKGLLWTAVGIGTVLAALLLERIWIVYREWSARRAKRPPASRMPTAQIHEDDRALAALWEEARRNLAASPEFGRQGRGWELSQLPLFLVVGPPGAGKSSTLVNSGIDPQLLAGQTRGDHQIAATRVANIFLSRNALFADIGGRIWDGELDRWTEFLRGFRNESTAPWWRRLWRQEAGKPGVRGVILFEDFASFSEKADPSQIGWLSKHSQERLQAISEVLGIAAPAYVVFAKSDSTPFFKDFFARLPSPECAQPLGTALTEHSNAEARTADQAARSYTKAFNTVASRLAERRVLHLSRESDASRKPAVYEFPREFRRGRPAFIQFLSEVFRPNPLRTSPFLRGLYFTGIRLVEAAPAPAPSNWTSPPSAAFKTDATTIFRPEATEIFRPGMEKSEVAPVNQGMKPQWMFSRQLFEEVVPFDGAAQRGGWQRESGMDRVRQILPVALCGVAVLLCLIWMQSWWSNRVLVAEAKDAGVAASALTRQTDGRISMDSLEKLEALRQQVAQLDESPSWRMRWGLYAGDSVQATMRRQYFERFNALLLDDLNRHIVDKLGRLPAKAAPADPFEPAYSELATHMRITSGSCKTNPAVVSGVLKTAAVQSGIAGEGNRRELVDRQIDYYSGLLDKEAALLTENTGAVVHARGYLSQIKSPERFYAAIREELTGKLKQTVRLADMVPEYPQVLGATAEMPELFSAKGRELFEKELSNPNRQLASDSCVLGSARSIAGGDPEVEKKIRSLYVDDYKAAWKEFLSKVKVQNYSGLQDASRKLEILSGQRSPILGVMGFASNNTYFAAAGQSSDLKEAIVEKAKAAIARKTDPVAKKLEKLQQPEGSQDPMDEIREAFQPVHAVVLPGSETWASEATKPYLNALADYRLSLQAIARSGSSAPDPAIHQAALAARDKAFEVVRQLSLAFEPVGTDGIDAQVRDLLEQPIRNGSAFIVANPEKAAEGKLNAQLAGLCTLMRPVLAKYPFARTASSEVSLEDLTTLFVPGTGAIWKYQQDSLGEYVVRQENRWVQKPEVQKPRISEGVLELLNRSQLLTGALYPAGSGQSTLSYSLRPAENSIPDQTSLEFNFDGKTANFAKGNVLRKEFQWPPFSRASSRAVAKVITPGFSFPFASGTGIWGVFRVFADAEPRALNDKNIEWKYNRVAGGQPAPMDPPVRMQFVDFPGGVDLFNPALWGKFQCPGRATQ